VQYFSLAATDSQLFAWGTNPQSQLGTGNSFVKVLLEPTAVAGPLGSGDWQIRGLAAGYQHAFAIADKPGDAELLKIKQEARASAGVLQPGVGASGVAGIEVVLTEKQRQQWEQKHNQQQQQQQQQSSAVLQQGANAAPSSAPSGSSSSSDVVAAASPSTPTAAAAAAIRNTAASAGRDVAAATPTTQHISQQPSTSHLAASSSSSSSVCSTPDKAVLPADWHTSYLPTQKPNLPLPRDTWAAWIASPWHNHLARLSPDVFELLPERYNAEHKNPCWGGLGPGLSCLPYFNIIGVSKCGTTDLYHRLTLHKQILAATNKVMCWTGRL
jgi:hypothetical protein